ncbi:MAG TPA: N-acetyltransferase [Candidatus Binataceae bacterium]
MEIRPAVPADVLALISILRRSWLTTWAPELQLTTVQRFATDDPARHYAESMWREFMVAEDGSALVAMFHIEGNCLNAIHLDPKRKRQGIGSRLMNEIERRISADYRTARLEVRAFNTGAIEFYKQRGWTEQRRYQATECGEPVETIEMIKVFTPRE